MGVAFIAPYVVIFLLNIVGGAIATLGVGLALGNLSLNLAGVVLAIVLADTISDIAYYCLGRFTSHTLRTRLLGRGRRSARRFAMVEAYFHDHGTSTVFLGKMSDVLALPAVVLAGATRMPFGRYLLICIPTSLLKAIVILTAGYLLSRSTNTADAHFVVYGIGGIFLIALIVLVSRQFYATMKKASEQPLKR